MADGKNISLRERITKEKLKNLSDKIKYVKKEMRLRDKLNAKALDLKSEEYEIHFGKLNGEYARIDKIVVDRVPRELYDQTNKELNEKIDVLTLKNENNITRNELAAILQTPSAEIKTLTSYKDVQSGKNMVYGVILAIALSLISAAISLFT